MTTDVPEQTVMKVEVPKTVYALCTFRIDIEKGALLPMEAAPIQSPWTGRHAWLICERGVHFLHPSWWCTCGVGGYASLSRLRAAHRQADTIVAVMRYDPTTSLYEDNHVRAADATLVAYWISPELPLRDQVSAVMDDLTDHSCTQYGDLDCMLGRYDIIECQESATDPDDEFRSVCAADGVAPLPRWAGVLGLTRAVLTARAVRSWSTVVGGPLRESFSNAVFYATKTTQTILMTIVVAWFAVWMHVYIRTHVTPLAFLDPFLLAGHGLISAAVTRPMLLALMWASALMALLDAVRGTHSLPGLADHVGRLPGAVLAFVYAFGERTVLTFGVLVVLAAANGNPLPGGLGWCLAAMFVLSILARSAAPFVAIYGRLRAFRAQPSWGATANV